MGCGNEYLQEPETVFPPLNSLSNSVRFGAYLLNTAEPDNVLIYDFQENESKIIKLIINPPLCEYTVHINYPLIFIAGGINKETNQLSKEIWSTSAGGDILQLTECTKMSMPRKQPFIISLNEGKMYTIGGILEDQSLSKVCEQFEIGDSTVYILPSMNKPSDFIIGIKKFIYAFGISTARNRLDVLDIDNKELGWEVIILPNCPITNLDGFGVLLYQEHKRSILIFGGRDAEGKLSGKTFSFDKNIGALKGTKFTLPKAEEFLVPTTSSDSFGFAISKNLELYRYDRKTGNWAIKQEHIKEKIRNKKLNLLH